MEGIQDILAGYTDKFKVKKYGSEYSMQLDMFLEPLNLARFAENEHRWAKYRKDNKDALRANFEASKGYLKPLTHRKLGAQLKIAGFHPGQSLYEFHSYCKQAKCFSAYFWWKLKQAKLTKAVSK